ncbi:hypothetical protein KEM48_005304 [Puccinia striiformis f. sp. tritici PST-130]|nr:hypothetical protein KEM48_005304 [Puccinia striiformis f. sp. tritici PST-130]
MPMLQPIYLVTHVKSLIGKEFKIFLQAAPFILFPFMNTFEQEIWLPLSTLLLYAFQTHINDMADFQLNLQKHVSNFLYRIVRLTAHLSGGITYNNESQTASKSSPALLNFFQNNKSIQHTMGYDPTISETIPHYPFMKKIKLTKEEKVNTARSGKYVAQVNSVWKSGASFFAHVTRLQRSKINDFYMMREFTKTSTTCSIKVKDIVATLNLQHNCHDGKCTIEKTKVTRVERQETNV